MKAAFFRLSVIIFFITTHTQAQQMNTTQQSEKTVREFLEIVRSGKAPQRAAEFMAETVIANQMNAEKLEAVIRTPQNYAEHIKEFLSTYGSYQFDITELIANNDKVYVRWKQMGRHLTEIDGFKPTGLPLIEVGSAVYQLTDGKITEYWIQLDRKGLELQLQQNAKLVTATAGKPAPPYTAAVALGEALYLSGQIGIDDVSGNLVTAGFAAEADQVMNNVGHVLKANNLDYNDLTNVTIYLTTMDNYAAMNEVYRRYFTTYFPARVCIAVKELPLGAHVEIAAVARLKAK
jgi:reactive intermediate/imine deaminase